MSIASTDIVVYASANMPEDDSTTSGGAIDTATRVIFTDISSTDNVEIFSSASGDTSKAIVVTGRLASGAIDTDTITTDGSDGTTVVGGTKQFERILKIVLPAHSGTITIRKDGDTGSDFIVEAETGVTTVRRPFYAAAAAAEASGAADKDLYEKVFIKNNHGTLSLLGAQVEATSDPSGLLGFALAASVNDTATVANRLASPGLTFNDTAKSVPGTDLAAGAAIGTWLSLDLNDGTAAAKTTYTLTVTGTST